MIKTHMNGTIFESLKKVSLQAIMWWFPLQKHNVVWQFENL